MLTLLSLFKSRTAAKVVVFSALLCSCQARLIIPSHDSPNVAIAPTHFNFAGLTSARVNDCYPLTVQLQQAGQLVVAPITTPVSVHTDSTIKLYRTQIACEQYNSLEEQTEFFLPAGASKFVAYFRASEVGEKTIYAEARGNPEWSSQQRVPVSFTNFNQNRGPNGIIYEIAKDPNTGKVVLAGDLQNIEDFATPNVARLNADGSLDRTFAATGTGLNNVVVSLAVQPDSKVVVGGSFTTYNGTATPYVARINTDGTLDTTFVQAGTGPNGSVTAVALQPDGKILVGGNFTSYNGVTARARLVRLNTNGSIDAGFNLTGTGLSGSVWKFIVQSDNKILIAGSFSSYNGTARYRIARLNSDGSLDNTFASTGTGLNGVVYSMVLQPDGKIVVGGNFVNYNGITRNQVARLNSDGTLDSSFVQTGTGLNSVVSDVALLADGRVLAGGSFVTYDGVSAKGLVRLNSDGSRDTSFVQEGAGFSDAVQAIALQDDGMVLIGGQFTSYNEQSRPRIARLASNGNLDSGFSWRGSLEQPVQALALQPDGKVLLGGIIVRFNGLTRSQVIRLDKDGQLDTQFNLLGAFNVNPAVLAVQADGKILVGGNFTSYDGNSRRYLARFNTDGSLDAGFVHTGTGLNGAVQSMQVQSDGKIVVGGAFTSYDGNSRPRVARINSDGSLDSTFVPTGTAFDAAVAAIAIRPDGKILVGGSFTSYNGTARPYIARLNTDGTLDGSFFQTGTGLNSSIFSLALKSDGKIVVGGLFTTYNGGSRPYLAQINTDGSLDTGFVPTGTGPASSVSAVAVQADGKVLAGGNFINFNGDTTRARLIRLNSDGSVDNTFNLVGRGFTFNTAVNRMVLQTDGRILVSGTFLSYGSVSVPYFNRLTIYGDLD